MFPDYPFLMTMLKARILESLAKLSNILAKRNETTVVNVRNIQKLMTEFFKCLDGLSPAIMKEIFTKRVLKCNLRLCRVTF